MVKTDNVQRGADMFIDKWGGEVNGANKEKVGAPYQAISGILYKINVVSRNKVFVYACGTPVRDQLGGRCPLDIHQYADGGHARLCERN